MKKSDVESYMMSFIQIHQHGTRFKYEIGWPEINNSREVIEESPPKYKSYCSAMESAIAACWQHKKIAGTAIHEAEEAARYQASQKTSNPI